MGIDFVEINRFTSDKNVRSARNALYSKGNIAERDALILMLHACRLLYGSMQTTKIVHSLGVHDIKL